MIELLLAVNVLVIISRWMAFEGCPHLGWAPHRIGRIVKFTSDMIFLLGPFGGKKVYVAGLGL